ncbi:MAG: tRNA (adenosine(37)-N6)-threonylcarbamoyltransferase complex ATPase subunit type 1 TsaE [Thermodesulfovibrionia bacterium]|nr:tRNA (adenosine(37)-N6)-threonylcarbamoyltransferase complex ATPase subunit type 1 TsaE [Thermodesulfovibrionia bacterium]
MKLQSKSEAETKKIGRDLGKKLKAGDIVCLYGELGAGKTVMVKGIASALGINERDVTSASFTIIAEYDTDVPFYHIDLYRIRPGETEEIGLQEYLASDGIAVIEWAERAEGEMPENRIMITLDYSGESSREIEIKGIEL